MNRDKIGVVTGLKAEARWLTRSGFMVRAGGGTPRGAAEAAAKLLQDGAQGLVSFGLAGGLKPGLPAGTLLVPQAVMVGSQTYPCDDHLMAFLGGAGAGVILGGETIAASAQDKALLYRHDRPDAVDLESGAVAQVASSRAVPFAVLRAVADPAERDLPPAASVALREDGSLDIARLVVSILTRPQQIPALMAVGRDAKAARAALLARLRGLSATI